MSVNSQMLQTLTMADVCHFTDASNTATVSKTQATATTKAATTTPLDYLACEPLYASTATADVHQFADAPNAATTSPYVSALWVVQQYQDKLDEQVPFSMAVSALCSGTAALPKDTTNAGGAISPHGDPAPTSADATT